MYNSGLYITSCLDSIFSQGVAEDLFEVVIIDDGSSDSSYDIAKGYAAEHTNMTVVRQMNQGPSVARNVGIEKSQGEYIWFIDSDDCINSGSLTTLLSLVGDRLDIVYFTAVIKTEHNGKIENVFKQSVEKNIILSGKEALKSGYYPTSSCIAIWNRKFLNERCIRFNTEMMYSEDSLFSFCALVNAKKVMFRDDIFYVYVKRKNSLTTVISPERILKQHTATIKLIEFVRELSETYFSIDSELAIMIHDYSNKVLLGLVLSLYRNRKAWYKQGITCSVLDKLKEAGLYPIKADYHSLKKNVLKSMLNRKKFLKA